MTIEQYTKQYKQIKEWYSMGWMTYGDYLDEMLKLKREYVKGKGSFLLPVVL